MGLADGFSLAGDYLVENLGLAFPKPASLAFDGARRHVGEDVFADFGEVVVLGDKEYDVVAVFAVGGGRAALFAAQLADYPFVPVAAAPVVIAGEMLSQRSPAMRRSRRRRMDMSAWRG